jgi:LuxR family maltose regulon positive regulatory protein
MYNDYQTMNSLKHTKFFWFGSPTIECNNESPHLETRKAVALLAYISLSPAPTSRENLAMLFWPEYDQAHALGNLRRTLSSINHTLGPNILESSRETISLNSNALIWHDVNEFHTLFTNVKAHNHLEFELCPDCLRDLEKSIILYRGDYLEGLNLRDCPEFDDWQYLQRESYLSDFTSILQKLAQAYSALGEWERAIERARHWVRLDRLNETAQRLLMQIYAQAGQRNAALHQFDECSRWLQDELSQSPESATVSLMKRIQSGEFSKSNDENGFTLLPSTANISREPLIKLKLFVPQLRNDLISRPHLINKLDQGSNCALTLISAPAGYGKTTLLSEWIDKRRKEKSSIPCAVCWLSLDINDNDPTRFLTYLSAAFESVYPELGEETRNLLESSQPLQPTRPLSILINELQELPQSVILILDDYQFINNPIIHEGMIFFLEHIPNNVHLVIATRSDPPLPLALLRGRNQLNELRAKDLRFTGEESASFLNKVFHLSLTPEQITKLDNRTEGWIAGLQMAAISLQGRGDIAQFIDVFSGSHRFILDYLTEEALNRQSVRVKAFLLQTSILERLCDPLCEAVIVQEFEQEPGSISPTMEFSAFQGREKRILKELEESNLFIIPLDDNRTWYRYHHLFSDLLRIRLEQTSPELISTLHKRASIWFEANGWVEESINHAITAKDWQNACRLVSLHVQEYLDKGQMATVLKWLDRLPQEEVFKYPKLCVQIAEIDSQAGLIDHVDPLLDKAEEIITSANETVGEANTAQFLNLSQEELTVSRSMIEILRGLKSICIGDPHSALNHTQKAMKEIPEMALKERAVLLWVEGWANRNLGNLHLAIELLTKATDYAIKSGAILRDIWSDLAITTRLIGKLPKSIDIFAQSTQVAKDHGTQNQGNLSRGEAFLSLILFEQNRLELASAHANQAIAYTRWWPSYNIIATAYTSLAQILLAQGDYDGSLKAIEKAEQARKNRLMTPYVHSLVDLTWVSYWLTQREWTKVDQWANDLTNKFNALQKEEKPIDEYLEMQLIMLVRVWMEKTKIDKQAERNGTCLSVLSLIADSSQNAGRINSLVEILLLKECVHYSQGKVSDARKGLDKCLEFAEEGEYVRIFLKTGELAYNLLSDYLQQPGSNHKVYALKIIKEFKNKSTSDTIQEGLLEPITSREMEVLRYLTKGFTNQEIAQMLVLSEGTVKFHVHHILDKLQVKNRTQAIAKARELHLV